MYNTKLTKEWVMSQDQLYVVEMLSMIIGVQIKQRQGCDDIALWEGLMALLRTIIKQNKRHQNPR